MEPMNAEQSTQPEHPRSAVEPTSSTVDSVARIVGQWRAVDPGLDLSPVEVITRVNRLATAFAGSEQHLVGTGLGRAEFDLLGTLRRTGHELTPSDLARESSASGAAVTQRLKVLMDRGLVDRRVDDRDRRIAWISLTDEGARLHAEHFGTQLESDRLLLADLGVEDMAALVRILTALLRQVEGSAGEVR